MLDVFEVVLVIIEVVLVVHGRGGHSGDIDGGDDGGGIGDAGGGGDGGVRGGGDGGVS